MASLTLKNLPEDLLESLRQSAERERRSLSQQIIHLLEEAVSEGKGPAPAVAPARGLEEARLSAWRRLAGRWVSEHDERTEAKQLVRARTSGRKVSW